MPLLQLKGMDKSGFVASLNAYIFVGPFPLRVQILGEYLN